jgi:hypothetical protein
MREVTGSERYAVFPYYWVKHVASTLSHTYIGIEKKTKENATL